MADIDVLMRLSSEGGELSSSLMKPIYPWGGPFKKLTNSGSNNLPPYSYQLVWTLNGQYIAYTSTDSPFLRINERYGTISLQNAATASLTSERSNGLAFSPDGQFLAITALSSPYVVLFKRSGHSYTNYTNVTTKRPAPQAVTLGVDWHPDGSMLGMCGRDNTVTPYTPMCRIFYKSSVTADSFNLSVDVLSSIVLPSAITQIYKMKWSPDGRFLILGCNTSNTSQPYVLLKQIGSGKDTTFEIVPYPVDSDAGIASTVRDIAWSPDGRFVAITVSVFPHILVYRFNRETGEMTRIPGISMSIPTDSIGSEGVAWHPSGKVLAAASYSSPGATFWSFNGSAFTEDASLFPTPSTSLTSIRALAWSPDGQFLAWTSASDGPSNYLAIYQTGLDLPKQGYVIPKGVIR